jgi:hypothetical protein
VGVGAAFAAGRAGDATGLGTAGAGVAGGDAVVTAGGDGLSWGRGGVIGPWASAGAESANSAGAAASAATRRTTRSNTVPPGAQIRARIARHGYRTPLHAACHIFRGKGDKPYEKCQAVGMSRWGLWITPLDNGRGGSSRTGSESGTRR